MLKRDDYGGGFLSLCYHYIRSEEQIKKFYGSGTATVLPKEYIADDHSQSDFKLIDEYEESPDQPLT